MSKHEPLLGLLDEMVGLLERRCGRLHRLNECMQNADMDGIEAALQDMEQMEGDAERLEQALGRAREQMAAVLGIDAREARLSQIIEACDGPLALALSDRRERLVIAMDELRRVGATAGMLTRHALELNQRLLAVLTGAAEGSTYSADGRLERQSAHAVVRHTV